MFDPQHRVEIRAGMGGALCIAGFSQQRIAEVADGLSPQQEADRLPANAIERRALAASCDFAAKLLQRLHDLMLAMVQAAHRSHMALQVHPRACCVTNLHQSIISEQT